MTPNSTSAAENMLASTGRRMEVSESFIGVPKNNRGAWSLGMSGNREPALAGVPLRPHVQGPMRTLALGVAVLALARPGRGEAQRGWPALVRGFDAFAAQDSVVGGSVLVMRDGRVVAHHEYGLADRASGRRVDDRTIFHWASITKTLTAVAVMQLRDRGKLALDDRITTYLPELRQVHDTFGSVDAITIRMLVSHSAGFQDLTWRSRGPTTTPWYETAPVEFHSARTGGTSIRASRFPMAAGTRRWATSRGGSPSSRAPVRATRCWRAPRSPRCGARCSPRGTAPPRGTRSASRSSCCGAAARGSSGTRGTRRDSGRSSISIPRPARP